MPSGVPPRRLFSFYGARYGARGESAWTSHLQRVCPSPPTRLNRLPEKPRNVYSFDYRGRGRSQYDRNWRNYTPFTETLDVLDFLTLRGLHKVGIVGTSRAVPGHLASATRAPRGRHPGTLRAPPRHLADGTRAPRGHLAPHGRSLWQRPRTREDRARRAGV